MNRFGPVRLPRLSGWPVGAAASRRCPPPARQPCWPLVADLGSDFYADEAQIAAAAQAQGSFNLIHLESMSKVDVYSVWRTDFGRAQLDRKRRVLVGRAEPL